MKIVDAPAPRAGRADRAALLSLALLSGPALADRPLTVDDAATLVVGEGKLEAGWLRDDTLRGVEVNGGYSPLQGLELEAGAGRGEARGKRDWRRAHAEGVAVKWVPLQAPVGLSAGLRYAYVRDRVELSGGGRLHGHLHDATALASLASEAGNALHLNLGRRWGRFDGERSAVTHWGLAAEHPLTETLTLTAEIVRDADARPERALGVRYLVTDDLALSAACGRGDGRNFWTAAVSWTF
ncbi:hypothetical protein [Azoarcus olearius]|uniref:Hypothetical secreted protein n=1 Tax=Azoarcus sp. (strain BH72) TaxID=418699 RepID=A1K4U1_AZOSB|nr:hypothetical protein [Azoarcus olearius]CAL93846.1 hypothetical secreted protein [Azoarcus olearius]